MQLLFLESRELIRKEGTSAKFGSILPIIRERVLYANVRKDDATSKNGAMSTCFDIFSAYFDSVYKRAWREDLSRAINYLYLIIKF